MSNQILRYHLCFTITTKKYFSTMVATTIMVRTNFTIVKTTHNRDFKNGCTIYKANIDYRTVTVTKLGDLESYVRYSITTFL